MQSLKLIIVASLVSVSMGYAIAAPTTELPQAPDNAPKNDAAMSVADASGNKEKPAEATVEPVEPGEAENLLVQDRLATIVEDDYAYERARRRLANEVELEKLRSEIRKLRGEDKPRAAAVPAVAKAEEQKPKEAPIVIPHVVLNAQIGGSQRVAVTDGDTLRYVRVGETFSMGGHDFKLAKDSKSVTLIKDDVQ